jgi:hypothetical protein
METATQIKKAWTATPCAKSGGSRSLSWGGASRWSTSQRPDSRHAQRAHALTQTNRMYVADAQSPVYEMVRTEIAQVASAWSTLQLLQHARRLDTIVGSVAEWTKCNSVSRLHVGFGNEPICKDSEHVDCASALSWFSCAR